MKGIFLSGHGHPTELLEAPANKRCGFCGLTTLTVYFCQECRLEMCKNCFKLRQEVCHWLHPQHPLRMSDHNSTRGICDGCNHFLRHCLCYKCKLCEFYLCVECYSSTKNKKPLRWECKKLLHYSHLHELTTCRFREEVEMPRCRVCDYGMWGVGYACVRCSHFVHESCIDTPQLVQHSLHLHPLKRPNYKITSGSMGISCKICKDPSIIAGFGCFRCKFYFHSRCFIHQHRAIKLEGHMHSLLCFPLMFLNHFTRRECPICNERFATDRVYSFFRCMECDLNFHFDCVPIPRTFKHKHHQHILALVDPSRNDKTEGYYCDICEARRDPGCYAYHCQQCDYFGHVECVLSREEDSSQVFSTFETKLGEVELPKHPDHFSQKQILYPSHKHPLSFQDNINDLCRVCMSEINGRAYTCKQCDDYWVHEKCVELPDELDHPLHPNHKLSFLPQFRDKYFVCSLCREITRGLVYSCRNCEFYIDVKCAFSVESRQLLESNDIKLSLSHLVHHHEVTLGHVGRDNGLELLCEICRRNCSGVTYCCMQCGFFVDKACLEWPNVIDSHPLHPEHRLQLASSIYRGSCYACDGFVGALWYECETHWLPDPSCGIFFHLECGVSLGRVLNQKHHDHHLYYFHKQPYKGHFSYDSQVCSLCQVETKASYYICLMCKLHFHLRCLQFPHIVKHKWHLHWLIFKDLADYGGYYCDICEEPRDLQHPVYCCEECNFVVHAECILSQENATCITLEDTENDHVINIPECCLTSPYSATTSD